MKLSSFPPVKRKMTSHEGWLSSGLVLALVWFPGWGWCETPPSPAPQPESRVSQPSSPQAASPSKRVAETPWASLREVIQKYSETTGNPVRMSEKLQQNGRLLDQVYSANDPSWLEDFSRIEIFNEQTGKKEIILLGKKYEPSPAGPGLNTRTPRKPSRKKISRARAPRVAGQTQPIQRGKSNFQSLKNQIPSVFGQPKKK